MRVFSNIESINESVNAFREKCIMEAQELWASYDENWVFNNPNSVSMFYEDLDKECFDMAEALEQ